MRRTSTGSKTFSFIICLDATKFVLVSTSTLLEKICPKKAQQYFVSSSKLELHVLRREVKLNHLSRNRAQAISLRKRER